MLDSTLKPEAFPAVLQPKGGFFEDCVVRVLTYGIVAGAAFAGCRGNVIMPLVSQLFASDAKLQACLKLDSAHLVPGARGEHVSKIHTALFLVDGLFVDPAELKAELYGKSTAAAVLAYKKRRRIINFAYQKTEDNIVGKMTIAALDRDVLIKEHLPADFPLKRQDKEFL